jgi:hypothetical protein
MTEIFVFGSNLRGIHGAGAAVEAREKYGAVWGEGNGRTGNAYGIPTKDENIQTRTLAKVRESIQEFIEYAEAHPELTFRVTKVGCGLAGFMECEIAPGFKNAPENCILPEGWKRG